MTAYFRLVRLPNVFTALADIIAGYFLAIHFTQGTLSALPLILAGASSATLYLSGMAFNDIADLKEDSLIRPSRPIPSGAVSLRGAVMCACGLMMAGIQFAAWTGWLSLIVATALAAAIFAYDFLCKGRTFSGPITLGICRFANIALGMSSACNSPQALDLLRHAPIWEVPWLPALALGCYGAGVTAFSAQEEHGKNRFALILGWIFTAAGMLACAALFRFARYEGYPGTAPYFIVFHALAFAPLAVLFVQLLLRSSALLRSSSTDAARALVLTGVKGYCLLDASMLLLYGDKRLWLPALAAILMLFPGGLIRKWLAQNEA